MNLWAREASNEGGALAPALDQTMSNPRLRTPFGMSNPRLRTPFGDVELRPIAPPPGAAGMQTYVLLPDLDELLRAPGFGLRSPILVRGKPAALSLH